MSPRTVLVTGAARGIGAAVALRMAADGVRVVALDRCSDDDSADYELGSAAQLEAVVDRCGNGAVSAVADVGDRAVLGAALDEAIASIGSGSFDAVVCAAGVVWGGPPVWETPPGVWADVQRTNVEGVLNVAALTVPAMLSSSTERTRRSFVAVASAAADRGLPRMGAYAASKAAVVSLVRSMAADLADSGVTVNAVAPGSTDTEILAASASVYGLESPEQFAVHHTDRRLLTSEEVAEAVVWLCSDGASGVTGSVLAVDAGMTAT